ncbi:wyosine base formation domain-containing protein, partial [Mycobacterium sp. ITM-2017-0098]
DLDALVADLAPDQWALETPAPGWTVAHQIAHLLWTDRVARHSASRSPGGVSASSSAAASTKPVGFWFAVARIVANPGS